MVGHSCPRSDLCAHTDIAWASFRKKMFEDAMTFGFTQEGKCNLPRRKLANIYFTKLNDVAAVRLAETAGFIGKLSLAWWCRYC